MDDYNKTVIPTQKDCYTTELTAVVTACWRPVQEEARQNSGMEGGGSHEVSSVTKELLEIYDCWKR